VVDNQLKNVVVQNGDVATSESVNEKPRRMRQPTAANLKENEYCWGTGRRKSAVARVRIRPGKGKVLINKKELDKYFPSLKDRNDVCAPFVAADRADKYDVFITVKGGGTTGQSGAAMLGVARALAAAEPEIFESLRDGGFLTRDGRMVERKKYGKKKARKSFQFSKR